LECLVGTSNKKELEIMEVVAEVRRKQMNTEKGQDNAYFYEYALDQIEDIIFYPLSFVIRNSREVMVRNMSPGLPTQRIGELVKDDGVWRLNCVGIEEKLIELVLEKIKSMNQKEVSDE